MFGPVDRALWDWPRFLDTLAAPSVREHIARLFCLHDLSIGDYTGGRFGADGCTVGFVGRMEQDELVLRGPDGEAIGRGWDKLVELLRALPEGDWHDLHIWHQWGASEAVARGHRFAHKALLPVVLDLGRIYLTVIAPPASAHVANAVADEDRKPLAGAPKGFRNDLWENINYGDVYVDASGAVIVPRGPNVSS